MTIKTYFVKSTAAVDSNILRSDSRLRDVVLEKGSQRKINLRNVTCMKRFSDCVIPITGYSLPALT